MDQPSSKVDQLLLRYETAEDACSLAKSIVDTIREPFLVLNEELRAVAASRSFYGIFYASREATEGQLVYALSFFFGGASRPSLARHQRPGEAQQS